MIALVTKFTCIYLHLASQFHFLLAIPNLSTGTDVGLISNQASSTGTVSRTGAYYNYFRFDNPLLALPSWYLGRSHFTPHVQSILGHRLPNLVPHPRIPNVFPPVLVHHPHISNVVPPNPITHPQIPNVVPYHPDIDSMITIFLNEHNKVRSSYGAPALTWNAALVPPAKRVTDTCTFRHTANNPFGENIAAGQTSPEQVVSQWVNGPEEKSAYDPRDPRDSHFTQVVWHGSQEIGCAVTSCTALIGASLPQSPIQFWACEYNPPGNVETLYTKNVHAAAGGAPLI